MPEIVYQVIRSDRRTLAIRITPDGKVEVRSPKSVSDRRIAEFVQSKAAWIQKHLLRKSADLPKFTAEQLQELADRARRVIPERVRCFAPQVGVTYGTITIRRQKTRWGSCSARGNLNFNCLLMLAPEQVLDYVVIHELCHRKEMNHSQRFWAQVARLCPQYQQARRWLKENGPALIARLG